MRCVFHAASHQGVSALGEPEVLPVRAGEHLRLLDGYVFQQRRGALDREWRRRDTQDDHRRDAVERRPGQDHPESLWKIRAAQGAADDDGAAEGATGASDRDEHAEHESGRVRGPVTAELSQVRVLLGSCLGVFE